MNVHAQLELPLAPQVRDDGQLRVEEFSSYEHYLSILELTRQFVDEIALDDDIDELVLLTTCHDCINDKHRATFNCWIAHKGTTPVGMLVGVCYKTWYNRSINAEQKIWFVSKPYRGTFVGLILLRKYDEWARRNGASHIYTGVANTDSVEQTGKLLERLGYKRVGSLHVKEA